MSGNHLMFGGIFLLWIFQLISGQLLTMQNLPQWRSVVSAVISICSFIHILILNNAYEILNEIFHSLHF